MEFLKLWILKLTLTIQYEKMAMHSLISDIKSQFPEAKGVKERWKLGLSVEEMVDIAQHHLKLPNFRGVIPKENLPLFTQYVIQEKPREQNTVIINTARDSEPGKRVLGPLCHKLITIVNCYLEAGLTCFVYCPKALYLIIFIVWHPL